ncbi:MAG TPA: hypothetical protein VKB02_17050 [Pyrinomonadaceae bacterium]|nr:hypothetical protein [Pyrinomonadaceae bacterium]
MKKFLVVCLGVLVLSSVALGAEAFALADRVGEPGERSFFLFTTSAGNYIVRQDGMGEFSSPKGMRRVFTLRVKGRIEQIYFVEHEGDVFIYYEVNDAAFLVRMEQTKRKVRWITELDTRGVPSMEGESVIVNSRKIRKVDGKLVTGLQDVTGLTRRILPQILQRHLNQLL